MVVAGGTLLDMLMFRADAGPIGLLQQYFTGYTVSPRGVVIGALWAFFVGWVAGWFVAFCRNFAIAAMVFWVRARSNFQASRDFLDHI